MNKMTLKDCCNFQEGYVNPSQTKREYFDGPIKWLRASDLNDSLVFNTEKSLSKKGFDSAGKSAYLFKSNTIAISKSGTIGKLGILKEEMCGNRAVINIDVNHSLVDLHYIFYTLKYKKKEIVRKAEGSIQKNLYVSALETISLNHNNKETQQKIASVLSALDSKIELNNRINAELEAMAKTLYDYWFVQFDFPDPSTSSGQAGKPYKSSGGKMVWNEELKREIPEGWEVGELKDIANITMGQSPPGETYNEIGEGMIFYQGCTDFGNRFPTVRKFTTEPTRFAKEGDILLSVRAPVGTLNISKEDCCIGRGLASLNSKENCIAYLFGVMVNLKKIFDRRNVDGTTFGSITKDDLFSLKVIKPIKSILLQYHSIINPAFEKQNKLELENQKLSELRDWLLPMLMNGQVKVGDVAYNTNQNVAMAAETAVNYNK